MMYKDRPVNYLFKIICLHVKVWNDSILSDLYSRETTLHVELNKSWKDRIRDVINHTFFDELSL